MTAVSVQPIVIAGAGPVGLTAAEMLTQRGIPVTVLEANEHPSREWRASTFHAATLELLEPTGLSDELMRRGLIADKVQHRDRTTGIFAEFDYSLIKDETRYPFRLQCPQSTYVKLVEERLQRCPLADLRFQSRFVGLHQDTTGVTVLIETPGGQERIVTPYLLGADGAGSAVRKALDIPFEGVTYEERFLLVGTTVPIDQFLTDIAYVNYISDPEEFLFILRVPEAWRVLYPIPPDVLTEAALDEERVQRQLRGAVGAEVAFPIVERMIYRVHQRVAATFRKGRVLVLGDAAHVNSPMGGLGVNNGIHDAVDLSRRLIRILQHPGANADAELDTYAAVRRRVALDYVRVISEQNTRRMKEKDPVLRVQLQEELAAVAADRERARRWLLQSSLLASVREQGIGEMPA